jgi:hypothetical protein
MRKFSNLFQQPASALAQGSQAVTLNIRKSQQIPIKAQQYAKTPRSWWRTKARARLIYNRTEDEIRD